jgi:hypothetical protein
LLEASYTLWHAIMSFSMERPRYPEHRPVPGKDIEKKVYVPSRRKYDYYKKLARRRSKRLERDWRFSKLMSRLVVMQDVRTIVQRLSKRWKRGGKRELVR